MGNTFFFFEKKIVSINFELYPHVSEGSLKFFKNCLINQILVSKSINVVVCNKCSVLISIPGMSS